MLCAETTRREIQKVLYRLQYIYDTGDAQVIDKFTNLFIASISHNNIKPIIDSGEYKLFPSTQTLESDTYSYRFPKQEFNLLYMFEKFKYKALHKDILVGCARNTEPVSNRTLWVLICRINKRLVNTNVSIVHVAQSTYMLTSRDAKKARKILDRQIQVEGSTMCIGEALDIYGREYKHFMGRIKNGWDAEQALLTPRMSRRERRAA